MDSESEDRLSTYLNDHHAGSTAGLDLARRAAKNNEGNEFGEFLTRIAGEIEEDVAALENVMDLLEIDKNMLKAGIAWIGEKAARLKPNDQLVGYSPLSRLIELEGLSLGVEGKGCLWRALVRIGDPRLEGAGLHTLAQRAERQRDELEEYRLRATAKAFGVRDGAAAAR
jgi:hypothetical protein